MLLRRASRSLRPLQHRPIARLQHSILPIRQTSTQTPPPPSSSSSSSSSYSSVDPSELTHFAALASEWWNPHGPSRLLHLMNPLRHDFISSCLATSSIPQETTGQRRYLDIGCGGGIFAESAARLHTTSSVLAIDPTPGILDVARAHASRDPSLVGKLTYKNSTIEALPLPTSDAEKYDVVSLFEVIEHVDQPSVFLDHVAPFVRPDGWLVLSTMARTATSWITTKFIAEDILGIVPRGTHDWSKYINEEELRGYFAGRVGWVNPRCMGVVYVPGLGWKAVPGSEKVGNYFFAIQREG